MSRFDPGPGGRCIAVTEGSEGQVSVGFHCRGSEGNLWLPQACPPYQARGGLFSSSPLLGQLASLCPGAPQAWVGNVFFPPSIPGDNSQFKLMGL